MNNNVISSLLDTKAITLSLNPPFTWTSGLKSPIYTDNRVLISYPDYREKILDAFIDLLENKQLSFDAIAATATAGIAWGAWIAQRMHKPLVYVRGSAKGHGKQNTVEGIVEKGERYLIVEDLISTGKSAAHAVDAIRASGGTVTDVLALFTYGFHSSEKQFNSRECTVHTLADFNSLLDQAIEQKYLSVTDKESLLSWKAHPEQWKP